MRCGPASAPRTGNPKGRIAHGRRVKLETRRAAWLGAAECLLLSARFFLSELCGGLTCVTPTMAFSQ